jgi:hypothetical protein
LKSTWMMLLTIKSFKSARGPREREGQGRRARPSRGRAGFKSVAGLEVEPIRWLPFAGPGRVGIGM